MRNDWGRKNHNSHWRGHHCCIISKHKRSIANSSLYYRSGHRYYYCFNENYDKLIFQRHNGFKYFNPLHNRLVLHSDTQRCCHFTTTQDGRNVDGAHQQMNGIVSNGESYKPSSGSHGQKIMNALNKLNINVVASKSHEV